MNGTEYEVIAQVSPRSIGPNTLFDEAVQITHENCEQFASDPSDVRDAKKALTRAGFHLFDEAEGKNGSTLTIGGDAKTFKEFFGAKITKQKAEIGPDTEITFMGTGESDDESLLSAPESFGNLIEGVVIVETVFAWPGIGKLLIDSINLLDRPVVVAYLMLTVFLFVMINLIVDIAYSLLDPRVRVKESKT